MNNQLNPVFYFETDLFTDIKRINNHFLNALKYSIDKVPYFHKFIIKWLKKLNNLSDEQKYN